MDTAGSRQAGAAVCRQANGAAKGAVGPPAIADGGHGKAAPTEQPATPSHDAPPKGVSASATSSLTEAAALDNAAPPTQPASAAKAQPSLQCADMVTGPGRTPSSRAAADGGQLRRLGFTSPTSAWEEGRRRQGAPGLGTALGRHEGDWGSAWGAGLTVLPSGASVSDASAASPASSVDLLAPRPSCIVDVAADPIVPPGPPPRASAIDMLLHNALQHPAPEDPVGDAAGSQGAALFACSAADDSAQIGHSLRLQQQQQQRWPRRSKLVTRSAQECSSTGMALESTTARSSAPVNLNPWRKIVPTSVFALSDDGQASKAAALATRCEFSPPDIACH